MMAGNGAVSVPPGFRFHPTDEELLNYYLRKKVSYEATDLDVIREVDLNKLEPWDLKDKCRIGSGPQNEWYFFSHKDKKYPTGSRTNRATAAGFWKATGRDKAIHLSNSKRIGMRKTLVFYTGRAPHGQKTEWIMHEYRLDDQDIINAAEVQEDGWVVCRVFKKKNNNRGFQLGDHQEEHYLSHTAEAIKQNHHMQMQALYDYTNTSSGYDQQQLPQLFSPESAAFAVSSFNSPMDLECSQNLLRLTSNPTTTTTTTCGLLQHDHHHHHDQRLVNAPPDWSFLDKLLIASHHHHHQNHPQLPDHTKANSSQFRDHVPTPAHKFAFQYLGCDMADSILKFSK